ncbi:hypothetical protein AYI70_g1637 [Smittium culicis]|nr:hypothetical protein AYI70_g1637 [Smittium culicis]
MDQNITLNKQNDPERKFYQNDEFSISNLLKTNQPGGKTILSLINSGSADKIERTDVIEKKENSQYVSYYDLFLLNSDSSEEKSIKTL